MALAPGRGVDRVRRVEILHVLPAMPIRTFRPVLHPAIDVPPCPPLAAEHGTSELPRFAALGRLRTTTKATGAVAATLLLGACAALPPARMALPETIGANAPEAVQGLGAGRRGEWVLGAWRGRFERGLDRLTLLDALAFDRASTRYDLSRPDGGPVQAACVGRQTTATVGIVNAAARPFTVDCTWRGATTASMSLTALPASVAARADRRGTFRTGDTILELESVHRAQGSPLPLDAPIGYLISHAGRPVGAIELNGTTPRLWRPVAGAPLHEPVTLAALALALLWDPAATP